MVIFCYFPWESWLFTASAVMADCYDNRQFWTGYSLENTAWAVGIFRLIIIERLDPSTEEKNLWKLLLPNHRQCSGVRRGQNLATVVREMPLPKNGHKTSERLRFPTSRYPFLTLPALLPNGPMTQFSSFCTPYLCALTCCWTGWRSGRFARLLWFAPTDAGTSCYNFY